MDMKRIAVLDNAWGVYEQWLKDKTAFCYERDQVRKMSFPEWLHTQYKYARIAPDGETAEVAK